MTESVTQRRRLVIVGNGMAGSRLAQELRGRDVAGEWHVTVVGDERHAAYNRILLSNVLAGTASPTSIRLGAADADEAAFDVVTGVAVTRVDRTARTVTTKDGRCFGYDVLVLATGSRAAVPSVDGLLDEDGSLVEGAVVFRTLDDCEQILRLATSASSAVVVGGGLLGLEAARGLVERGLQVDLVHRAPFLMERQLDVDAGAVLARTVTRLGVRVWVDRTTACVRTSPAGRVRGVGLDDGSELAADLLVLACGIVPETSLARACGLDVDRGVVVDDRMRTSDPHVYAIGECAQHAGQVYGLVAPAWEQAAVLAVLLTEPDAAARYSGSRLVTRLKAAGVELAAMGDVHVALHDDAEVLQFADPVRGTYKKLVIRDGRITGAILLGDVGTVGTVMQLYDRAATVPGDRLTLLFAGIGSGDESQTPARIPDRATVCRCNGVTKGAITASWLDGAVDVDAVVARTRATTGCGSCRMTVEGIVEWLAAAAAEERSACA